MSYLRCISSRYGEYIKITLQCELDREMMTPEELAKLIQELKEAADDLSRFSKSGES